MITLLVTLMVLAVLTILCCFVGLVIAILAGSITLMIKFIVPIIVMYIGIRLIKAGLKSLKKEKTEGE